MCRLSKQEKRVLDELLAGARPEVVALRLKISKGQISVIKTRVRRKEAKAKKFLTTLKKYHSVLHKEHQYRGI